jgi:hypothetical protein
MTVNKVQSDIKDGALNNQAPEIEHRSFPVPEIRAIGEGQDVKISGYAAIYNLFSEDLGGFVEIIQPGAFSNTLKNDDIRDLFNHDPSYIVGRTSSGTLKLTDDSVGLAFEATPPDTQWAQDMIISIQRGDLTQMSFGFRTIADEWKMVGDKVIRTLIEVKLYDVSQVTFPAYPQTSASVRSAYESFQSDRPAIEPGQEPLPVEPQADPGARAHLVNLRRRLDLAEKS